MTSNPRLVKPNLTGRVALVTGSSRGIGRECALALARCGAKVVVAAKTVDPTPNLPGTIYTVAREIEEAGGVALPVQMDLRDAESCERCVVDVIAKFGRIDILINNASAMWWHTMEDTPVKKFDLITSINSRGSFIMTKLCLPHMKKNNYGRVINMSPPISTDFMRLVELQVSESYVRWILSGREVARESQRTSAIANHKHRSSILLCFEVTAV
ncbi:hypothetical protein FOZ63_019828 [Perkinsus olseni]|uniref:Uncharacterized protein n=1 Tax=Perkinsus olseni TaxID=32597 RepID=A0A7J6Q0G7_PEROL|nr:hypothetical protein FOZ63_019828 [Perkinsus olseni]